MNPTDEATTSDAKLMELVKSGRVEHLSTLFLRHHRQLFNFFLRQTCSRSISEDLVQEVFYRILKYRSTYQNQAVFSVWMYRIARNVHFDLLRSRREEIPLEESPPLAADRAQQPEEKTATQNEVSLIQKALDMIAPKKKELLLLTRFQEMKYKDIATLLGRREGTVKADVHRALLELGKRYRQLQGEVIA